jgi:copper(I)-binding protein
MRRAVTALMLAAALAACRKHDVALSGTLEVHDAWVRADPDTGSTTAAYLRFVNGTNDALTIAGFTSDAARSVELHRSSTDNAGAVHMAMDSAVHLAPHGTLVMQPGAYHLMLIGVTRPLQPGDHARIVMHVSNGSIVSTMARVR